MSTCNRVSRRLFFRFSRWSKELSPHHNTLKNCSRFCNPDFYMVQKTKTSVWYKCMVQNRVFLAGSAQQPRCFLSRRGFVNWRTRPVESSSNEIIVDYHERSLKTKKKIINGYLLDGATFLSRARSKAIKTAVTHASTTNAIPVGLDRSHTRSRPSAQNRFASRKL
jgi:hypothetical protein